MAMCSARIGHVSTRTGKEIIPTIAHSCELQVGHDGPHFSPMDRRSITERAQWDAEAKDRLMATGPLAKLQGAFERVGAADPDTGRIAPAPSTLVPCLLCSERIPYSEVVTHVMGHAQAVGEAPGSQQPRPRVEMPSPLPLQASAPTGKFPFPPAPGPESQPMSDSKRYSQALNDVLDWVVSISPHVQLPAKVNEAVQVLRPPHKG